MDVEVEIFAGAVDYAQGKTIDGNPCTWIRMRVFVDSSTKGSVNTWREYDRGPEESIEAAVARHLAANDIAVRGIKGSVARIDTKSINLSEYSDFPADEGISVRTFLTVDSGTTNLFGEDNAWNMKLGTKTISEWYKILASIV